MFHAKLFIGALLLAGCHLLQAAEPDPVLVATPRAKALAATATSRPFLAAARSQQAVDLTARGYAEGEYAVRGHAGAGRSWVTRILVRRPLDAGSFSGRVVVELLDASAQYDAAPLWSLSWDYFLRRGDAWVGVTTSPAAVESLKKFNAARYGTLSLDLPQQDGCGDSPAGGSAGEVLAQVGALLRSSSKENPLLALNPQRLVVAGHAQSGDHVASFAATLHRALRLGNGEPIFDGYLNVSGHEAVSSACAAALPRYVPFVSVLTEADIALVPDRNNGDAGTEGWRVYEVAGVVDARPLPAGAPVAADLAATGVAVQAETRCREPAMDQALAYAINAVWQQVDDLLVRRQPMDYLPHIASADTGTEGGWRLPQVDLPLAGRSPTRPVCDAATGSMRRFDAATLKQRYRSRVEYLRSFGAAVDQAVLARLLVKEDAETLKAATARGLPAF